MVAVDISVNMLLIPKEKTGRPRSHSRSTEETGRRKLSLSGAEAVITRIPESYGVLRHMPRLVSTTAYSLKRLQKETERTPGILERHVCIIKRLITEHRSRLVLQTLHLATIRKVTRSQLQLSMMRSSNLQRILHSQM